VNEIWKNGIDAAVLTGVKKKERGKEIDPLEIFTVSRVEEIEGGEKTDVLIIVKRNITGL
jgi:hypothetical protein